MLQRKSLIWLTALILLALVVFLNGCGAPPSSPPTNQMSFIFYNMEESLTASIFKPQADAWGTGETGSLIESEQMKLDLIELEDSPGHYSTVYSGNQFFETRGLSTGVTGTLTFNKPPAGTYSGFRVTSSDTKCKAKVKIGGTFYYTTNATINAGDAFPLSTNLSDYGTTTITATSQAWAVEFTTPLVVTETNQANIVYIGARNYENVSYYGTTGADPQLVAIHPEEIFRAFLPAKAS